MLGENRRREQMFYYVRMEDIVPEDHLLRLVDKHIDLSFIRGKVKHLYSHTGRPSIAPEVLLRMLLIGYLYGISSERRLCEEVGMHIGYRWFVGLNLQDKVPDHSTFSKNRNERFAEGKVFQEIFDEIVVQAMGKKLISGRVLYTDSTHLKASANKNKFTGLPKTAAGSSGVGPSKVHQCTSFTRKVIRGPGLWTNRVPLNVEPETRSHFISALTPAFCPLE